MPVMTKAPTFFATLDAWRAWLAKHHQRHEELWVGFYKRDSGRPSITWPESVDGALAFGWIDGVRKRIDEVSYVIRFTPRKKGSVWSAINIRRVGELDAQGHLNEAGRRAFEGRSEARSRIYAYEQRHEIELTAAFLERFEANPRAKRFFDGEAPWYKKTALYWVMSAKREETRASRLTTLIADSAAGRRIKHLISPGKARPPEAKPTPPPDAAKKKRTTRSPTPPKRKPAAKKTR